MFTRYLEFFRDRLAAKTRALPAGELRRSRLPSGWTPLELVKHLTYVELRWLEWGFEGRAVADPWGDQRDDRWYVGPDETLDGLLAELAARAARSSAIINRHDLDEVGQPGERWSGQPPATLERVLFHLVQEYARHLGGARGLCSTDSSWSASRRHGSRPAGYLRSFPPAHILPSPIPVRRSSPDNQAAVHAVLPVAVLARPRRMRRHVGLSMTI